MFDGGLAVLSATQADRSTVLLLALGIAVVIWLTIFTSPKRALLTWVLVIAFVPVWLGLNLSFYFLPGTLVGLAAIVTLRRSRPGPISLLDLAVIALFVATLATVVVPGGWSLPLLLTVVTQWVVAFALGRLASGQISLTWIYRTLTITMAVVGALAILEFVAGWNPFVEIPGYGPLYQTWGALQERGDIIRAEGAFGHSIALGASLSMTIPIALSSNFSSRVKLLTAGLMVGGAVVSFSRLGLIGCVLAVVLSVYALPNSISGRLRLAITGGAAIGALALFTFVSEVFTSSTETATSAAYRGALIELIPEIAILGRSDSFSVGANGGEFANFASIDNALLLLGLRYGWIPLALALLLLAATVWTVLTRNCEPPTVAIASQIPALLSVALITQFAMYFWFMAGLAVAAQVARKQAQARQGSLPDPAVQEEDPMIPTDPNSHEPPLPSPSAAPGPGEVNHG